MPLPAGIPTGLFSTADNSNPPAGESILYCSGSITSYPSIFTCRSDALPAIMLAHILCSSSVAPKKTVPTSRSSHITLTIGNRIDVPCLTAHSCSGKPFSG